MAVKKVMVLSGVANAGKTNTLNRLAEELASKQTLLWAGKPSDPIQRISNPVMQAGQNWYDSDHYYCFLVKTQSKTITVAISTRGDTDYYVTAALNTLSQCVFSPDVIVLASRSCWCDSVEAIENWSKLQHIMPEYTAIMHKCGSAYSQPVEKAIVTRLYGDIIR